MFLKRRFFLSTLFLFIGMVMLDPTNKLFHMKEILFVILLFITIALQFGKFYKEVVVFYG